MSFILSRILRFLFVFCHYFPSNLCFFYYFYNTHLLSFLNANMNAYIKISQCLNDYILLPFTYRLTCPLCNISYEKTITGKIIKFNSFYVVSSHFEMFNELVRFLIINDEKSQILLIIFFLISSSVNECVLVLLCHIIASLININC